MKKPVFWEIILILASVPLFRSLWLLMDGIEWFNGRPGLYISFSAGLVVASLAVFRINEG